VNAGTGAVTIASTAGGAVVLGGTTNNVANTLTLSNAELGKITAGVLGIDGGTISNDTAVTVSGIGTLSLIGSSVRFNNNFVVNGGDLGIVASGAVNLFAGAQAVQVQASNVTINTGSLSLNGGTGVGAVATIDAGIGNVVINAGGAVNLVGGSSSNSDAWILSTGNIAIRALSCGGCSTRIPNVSQVPINDTNTDTGLGANGTISVVLLGTNLPSDISQILIVALRPPPSPPPPPPPVIVTSASSGNQPTLTDTGGTAGGEVGSFGGTDSASGAGSAQGSSAQGGTRAPGAQRQRAKANAGC